MTAVGATQGPEGKYATIGEYGCQQCEVGCSADKRVTPSGGGTMITTGGGFSTVFTRANGWGPSIEFQRPAVDEYLRTARASAPDAWPWLSKDPFTVATGRGFPDVAALGSSFLVFTGRFPLVSLPHSLSI